jgi:MOSC domain-containing protein YiiM
MDALALEAGLEHILQAPADTGTVAMIVRRPAVDQRQVLEHAELDAAVGLVGDNWLQKGSRKTEDGAAHPEMQLNLMNSRVIELVAGDKQNWPLAGDQLFVDFALTEDQLPPGTRLVIGSSIIEVTAVPHLGCKKFSARFGLEAMKFVNSTRGKKLHLRGINAKVIKSGSIRTGDKIFRLEKP